MPEQQSAPTRCHLALRAGLGIGYQDPIAHVAEDIALDAGTHYLLARNGRGKTTLLKTLSELIPARAGDFETRGRLQFIADDLSFDKELDARTIFLAFLPAATRGDALKFAEQLELDVRKPFGKLSYGNRKKVGLVLAEMSAAHDGADLLLYDEPFTGLDTPARRAILDRWEASAGEMLRLVSCHPDLDEMAMPSALLISDGRITRPAAEQATWSDLKQLLN